MKRLRPNLTPDVDYLCIDRSDGQGPCCEWKHASSPPTTREINAMAATLASEEAGERAAQQSLKDSIENWDTLTATQKWAVVKIFLQRML